jgi:cell division protein FtsQ
VNASIGVPRLGAEDRVGRGLFRRKRANRRAVIRQRPLLVWIADGVTAGARIGWRILRVVGVAAAGVASIVGLVAGTRTVVRHVVESPRFGLREVVLSPSSQLASDEIISLAGVAVGDRLLSLDADAVASRLARHPWVESVRVQRRLPSALAIDIVEREAVAAVALGGLYLVSRDGRPFKRAAMAEAEGLPIVTGIDRAQYVDGRDVVEAVIREALGVIAAWQGRAGRPALSEINVHPRRGLTAILSDTGTEVRLGRGELDRKLARLDRILEAVAAGAPAANARAAAAIDTIHLDVVDRDRVPVKLATIAPNP